MLEKEGIGRPSTYATILNTIRARAYTTLDERKRFVPTDLGTTVVEMLVKNLPKIMDPKFTANMENDLDKIEQGELKRDKLLHEFYQTFKKDVKEFAEKDGKGRATKPTGVQCPKCKKDELLIRFGKAGEFVGCNGYPECDFTSNFTRNEDFSITLVETKAPELLDELCPKCKSQMRKLMGKYGEFIACSAYPKCKYIKQNKAGYNCPVCKKGELVQRVWRGGKFWGCSNYPKCKFNVFDQIRNVPCKKCKYPFTVEKIKKDGSSIVFCANKECNDALKVAPKKSTKK
jgi:DNA topoisomerase-1